MRSLVNPCGALLVTIFGLFPFANETRAQVNGIYQSPEQRSLYDDSEGSDSPGTLFDPSNPMGLMNLLQRATAMDDATSPSDAVDQALQSFESEEKSQLKNSLADPSLP